MGRGIITSSLCISQILTQTNLTWGFQWTMDLTHPMGQKIPRDDVLEPLEIWCGTLKLSKEWFSKKTPWKIHMELMEPHKKLLVCSMFFFFIFPLPSSLFFRFHVNFAGFFDMRGTPCEFRDHQHEAMGLGHLATLHGWCCHRLRAWHIDAKISRLSFAPGSSVGKM